jgi:hypothetical protein
LSILKAEMPFAFAILTVGGISKFPNKNANFNQKKTLPPFIKVKISRLLCRREASPAEGLGEAVPSQHASRLPNCWTGHLR